MKKNQLQKVRPLIVQCLMTPLMMMFGAFSVWAQNAVVSNVQAQQRAGSKLVDITYDLDKFNETPVYIYVQISELGDGNYNLPVETLIGDRGSIPVSAGTGKKITWNAGADWDGHFTNQAVVKLFIPSSPLDFSFIPAGSFIMGGVFGDAGSNEKPSRRVYVRAFYMKKKEVTKAEWDEVATWASSHGYDITAAGGEGKTNDHPVQKVTWYECVKWCNAKSEKEGKTPVYTVSGSTYKTGIATPEINYIAFGYRLPTEAEWEKASRGGLVTKRFPWGDTIEHSKANFYNEGIASYTSGSTGFHPDYVTGLEPYTSPVGSFQANGYGLFDMSGNVYEWCNDWYSSSYYGSGNNTVNPTGPNTGSDRVCRGGSYDRNEISSRCSSRTSKSPSYSERNTGFRLSLPIQ